MALKRIIDFCRKFGVAAQGIQLAHAGRKASTKPPALGGLPLTTDEGAWETVAPSPIPYADGWHVPRELTKAEIEQIQQDFIESVKRAERVGYELIEMHAGHGYLTHQFLSPLSNTRTDEYGGSLKNRMRFPLETFAAMRKVWPEDKPMGVRVSVTDWAPGGTTIEDSIAFIGELKKLGCDYVDVSSGGLVPTQQVPLAPGYHLPYSQIIKNETGMATLTVGLITDYLFAEQAVATGRTDLVCLARGAMWDPRWAWHAAEALGAETPYPPRSTPCHPSLRPQVFPNRKPAA
jgi:2,4-dienoyl-CoA reductase-like NADH-dependent reductase (Old Yellow Enzyme family)